MIDITDSCSDTDYYRYEIANTDGSKSVILIGGTIENNGWVELVFDAKGNYVFNQMNVDKNGNHIKENQLPERFNEDFNVLIVAEVLTMYLSEQELKNLLEGLNAKFGNATIVFDAYSRQAVKSSKLKNPVNQMNASIKWGMNDPSDFTKLNEHLEFVREYLIRNKENNLKGITKFIFENLYCGKISESLYKIYEFRLKQKEEKER